MVDGFGSGFLHLVAREMDEQVGDAEHGVGGILAHADIDRGAVLLAHDAMDGERGGYPVVGLHAAVVVGVEVGHIAGLVQRVLLDIESRAVDMRAQDVHALFERGGAQVHEHEGLLVVHGVNLVAGLEGTSLGHSVLEVYVAGCLGEGDGCGHALALGFVLADEGAVVAAELFELGKRCVIVCLPCVRTFHGGPFLRYCMAECHGSTAMCSSGEGCALIIYTNKCSKCLLYLTWNME